MYNIIQKIKNTFLRAYMLATIIGIPITFILMKFFAFNIKLLNV